MDEKRFDEIARVVGALRSRRDAVRVAIGSVLGISTVSVVFHSDTEDAAAQQQNERNGKSARGTASAKSKGRKNGKRKGKHRNIHVSSIPPDGCGEGKICHCPPGNNLNCQTTGDGTGHSNAGHEADCCCNDPGCDCTGAGSSCCKPTGTSCFNALQCCGADVDCVDKIDGIGFCCAAGQVWNFDTGACCTPDSKATTCKGKCGVIKNNCGKQVDCGDCPAGIDCVNHICVCPAKTCADFAGQCGTFDDGCGGTVTCKCDTGCCGDGLCLPGTSPDACGTNGEACQVCTDPDRCNDGVCSCIPYPDPCEKRECGKVPNGCGGSVTCGPNDGACPVGETCEFDSGMCFCGPDCKGCCSKDTCQPGNTNDFCGTAGETCVTCTGFDACIDGDCVCVPEPNPCGDRECGQVKDRCGGIHVCGPYDGKCLPGDTCDTYGGMCYCGPDCTGCCAENTCLPGDSNQYCGVRGDYCATCTGFDECISGVCTCVPEENPCGTRECGKVEDRCGGIHVCGPLDGECAPGLTCKIDEGICYCGPNCVGCCDGDICRTGDSDSYCGIGGERCKTCAPGQDCHLGICTCDGQSCEGCCDGLTCQPGNTVEACGIKGEICSVCDGKTESCVDGDCVCDPTKCEGVCCDNICVPGGVCCVNADCDPNETCVDNQCSCPSGKTCGDANEFCCPSSTNVCTPTGKCCAPTKVTCDPGQCGTYDDGCGNPVDCGDCSNGWTCSEPIKGGICECLSGNTCEDDTCHEACASGLVFDPKACDCVQCIDDQQCNVNEVCLNSICVCTEGFKECNRSCIPVDHCCLDADCKTPGTCEIMPGKCNVETGACSYPPLDCSTPGVCEINPGACNETTGLCEYKDAADLVDCGTNGICCTGSCVEGGACCDTADCGTPAICKAVTCTGNQCVTSNLANETVCGTDSICCSGSCVSNLTDVNNCGSCGNACGANSECVNGICVPLCVGTGDACTVNSDCCIGLCLNNVCSTQTCAAEGESCLQIPCCDTTGNTCVGSGNARICQPTPPAPPECVHVGQRPDPGEVCCPRLHLEQGICVVNRWDHCDPKHKAKQAFCERGTRCIGGRVSPHEETVCVPVKKRRGRGSERTAVN